MQTFPEITGQKLNALRYSCDYETVLSNPYGRHRIFVELASSGKKILELGCADGFISRHLSERGCHVTGIEIDPEAAAIARQYCAEVLVQDLNKAEWTHGVEKDYDTVLCGDVLEHLVDPVAVLRLVQGVLAPGGRVIICLPNIAHIRIRVRLLFGRFEYQPGGILDVTHLRFFTYRSARQFIEDAGYRILSYQPMVGGGVMTHWMRSRLHTLFAGSMLFVATPNSSETVY